MTFDEWLKKQVPMTIRERTLAESAWSAATIEERERCAKIAEQVEYEYNKFDMADVAKAIRGE